MVTATFRPLAPVDGYLPLEDYGLIGDGFTAALVGRDGTIAWMCAPRFDSPPVFCRILDARRGGAFTMAPEELHESRQYYEPETGVLVTEMRGRTGLVRVTDAFLLRSGADLAEDTRADRHELLRSAQVLEGRVRLRIAVEPYGGAEAEPGAEGLRIHTAKRPDVNLHLWSTVPLDGMDTVLALAPGDPVHLILSWGDEHHRHRRRTPEEHLDATREAWRRWMACFSYEGPRKDIVRRSAITLKLLDFFENGALLAAATSSLPETVGGVRNWDYRYAWVRDAAFSVYAMRRIGLTAEAIGFLGWVLNAVEKQGRPRVLYSLDGDVPPPEREDGVLEGYRRSRPVRWGNGAAEQRQHDVYGEILDSAYQWMRHGGRIGPELWKKLETLAEAARREWRTPDHGIWEVRTPGRPFTYSAALCHVALDRASRIAESLGLPGDVGGWRREAERIRRAILEDAWDPEREAITESLEGGGLDASVLSLPLRRVLPADHPRMVATTEAVARELGAGNGLVYRYLPDVSPDGLPGHEGAFLLCSFWLVDNYTHQGRMNEAMALFDSLCDRAGPLGLLPEQIDPSTGAFLGNHPQALSHVGIVSSGVTLARRLSGKRL
jgi:alpha,alpha-trehalase